MKTGRVWVALLAVLALAACESGRIYPPADKVNLEVGETQNLQVFANGDWRDAGVTLRRGESYEITAEGSWTSGAFCGVTDASGAGVSPLCGGDPWGIGVGGSTLIGRIGINGKPFGVGKRIVLKADADGPLFLRDYDLIEFDNTGFMQVRVRRHVETAVLPPPLPQTQAAVPPVVSALQFPLPANEKRVALVIGNGAYKDSPLRNQVNDARAMAQALNGVGFEVILRENTTQRDMLRAVGEFGRKLSSNSVGLFYYAGHGIQVRGKNFLIPIDAAIQSEAEAGLEALDVERVLEQMQQAGNRMNMVILDACRNNPFERRFRSVSGGLAQIDAPKGTLIAYATAPGKVAADGEGANGLYTQELLQAIRQPGLKVEDVFKRVRGAVAQKTADQQMPWEASSLTGDFFFSRP
ncbi:MAG: caspase family protein [Rhodospirillales bacterium]|nr:caspase family protein [Rhodospirillales bacterium]